jgi:glycosyltransferase involved in cell wall biosynthesis
VTLLIDVFNHGHTWRSLGAWRGLGESVLESICRRGPFVHLANAYVDTCNLPYLPCSGGATPVCPHKPLPLWKQPVLRDSGDACSATWPLRRLLHENAVLNVFVSPLHQRITEQVLGRPLARALVLRPLVDTRLFSNARGRRDIEYLFVGMISEAKGLAEMRRQYRHTDIHLIGRTAPGVRLDFGRYLGPRPYEEIPRWMNRAVNFVFLPRWPEPQGRVVAEAALCGCRVIGNANIGALTFGFDLADPSAYAGAEDEFWTALETCT